MHHPAPAPAALTPPAPAALTPPAPAALTLHVAHLFQRQVQHQPGDAVLDQHLRHNILYIYNSSINNE